jgi:beta-glucanase (GH16 family)
MTSRVRRRLSRVEIYLAIYSYGKFSFEVQCPDVAGVVVAAILTAPGGDEIDIEILGGDPRHWQV